MLKVPKAEIAGVGISITSRVDVLRYIEQAIVEHSLGHYIVTPNIDHIVKLQKDRVFREVYERAFLVLPDGMPIIWAARLLGIPLIEKISGSDLFPQLCMLSARKGYRLFFLGGREDAAIKAANVLRNRMPGVQIVGCYSPPFEFENNDDENKKIVKLIRNSHPDILCVGLGAPKQEKWIFKYRESLKVPVSIGVGISFEFIAGIVRRAPIWMRNSGLEWFWRLLMEPRRLARRYLIEDPRFLWLILKQTLLHSDDKPWCF